MQRSSQSRPNISIGMPVFNCAGTVAQAICSILNQTLVDWELLVIDDGSTDDTFRIAASFDDPRIIVIRGRDNKGLPARLNECVSSARGKYFARMDGDDIAYPGRFEHQLEFLQSHPEVDLAGGWVVVFQNEGKAYGARRSPLTHEQICAHPWKGIPMAHPTWMGKAEWFLRNPYRTDALRMQDQELLFRTCQKSRFACLPEIVLGYREDSLSLSRILLARMAMCRMMVCAARKEYRFIGAALGIVGLAAKGLVDILAISTGLKYHILRHRATALRDKEEIEWRTVWDQVRLTSDRFQVDRECVPSTSQKTAI